MKKYLLLVLCAVLLTMCLTACGDSSSNTDVSKNESSSSAEATTTTSQSETETTTTTTAETTTTTTTTQATTTAQSANTQTTSKIERVGIPYRSNKIQIANANAKFVLSTLNITSADLIADGYPVDKVKTNGVVPVESFANSSNSLEQAVYEAFTDLGSNYGYVYINYDPLDFDDNGKEPNFVQWSEDATGTYIGQFPDPVDATNWSTIKFGVKQ